MSDRCTHSVVNGRDCYYCEAIPGKPGTPGRWDESALSGWGSGARSILEIPDDGLRVKFSVGQSVGIITGLSPPGDFEAYTPSDIWFGFYLYTLGGGLFGQPIEFGSLVGSAFQRSPDDSLEVRRSASSILYVVNDNLVHVSAMPSTGPLCVVTAMYQSGDVVN